MKIRSGYCIQFLLLALLARACGAFGETNTNTGTTGLVWAFANGVMDWNTFQCKPLVQVTLHHFEHCDTYGNWREFNLCLPVEIPRGDKNLTGFAADNGSTKGANSTGDAYEKD